jgi:hypothetical protein
MAQSPAFLVNKGDEVCDKMTRGWGWDYIKMNLRDPSLYEDVEPIAVSAAIHLCGMTQDQTTRVHQHACRYLVAGR